MKHIFEIYTKNPKTGETGWDVCWVRCTREAVETFPNFDCIITTDDFPMVGNRSIIIDHE